MPHRPRDTNALAKLVVDMATGQVPKDPKPPLDPEIVEALPKTKKGKKRCVSA